MTRRVKCHLMFAVNEWNCFEFVVCVSSSEEKSAQNDSRAAVSAIYAIINVINTPQFYADHLKVGGRKADESQL